MPPKRRRELVRIAELPHLLVRYEDLCTNPEIRQKVAAYVGLERLGNDRSTFQKVVPFRQYEVQKHGIGVSNASVYRHRSEPLGPAIGLATQIWRTFPDYAHRFGYERPGPEAPEGFISFRLGTARRSARKAAANIILSGTTVLDLSCGTMSLESMLPEGCTYIPCDVAKRNEQTRICNPNEGVLPEPAVVVDVAVALGLLEYVRDLAAFFLPSPPVRHPSYLQLSSRRSDPPPIPHSPRLGKQSQLQ